MPELTMPDELTIPELISYAKSSVVGEINSSENADEREHMAEESAKTLNGLMELGGGERRLVAWNARFRGVLPDMPGVKPLITGSIEGTAFRFEPRRYDNYRADVLARYLIVLSVVDVEGYLTIDRQHFIKNNGVAEYVIDLVDSQGPFEEVA